MNPEKAERKKPREKSTGQRRREKGGDENGYGWRDPSTWKKSWQSSSNGHPAGSASEIPVRTGTKENINTKGMAKYGIIFNGPIGSEGGRFC